jgi:hypothetical protein
MVTALAAIVLVAGTAQAQGNGRGGGQGGRGNDAAHAQGGGKPDKASRQGGGQIAHAPVQAGGRDRGNERSGEAQRNRGNGNAPSANDRGPGDRVDNGNRNVVVDRGRGNNGRDVVIDRGRGNNGRVVIDRRDGFRGDVVRVSNFRAIPARGLVAGCPPGLAKKNPPCVPPGQVRNRYLRYDRPDFWGLRLGDGRYRYDNGYLLRLGSDGRIGSYIPLLGGALAIGNAWPTFYQPVALPAYYESYYGLGAYDSYRYADNVIYRINPESAAITSVAALLTGDDFVVGRPMPVGYDVYNVPYAYRTQYVDGPTAMYRYADGHVYQLDPETRLIAAAIELAVS